LSVEERASDGLSVIVVCGEVERSNVGDLEATVTGRMAAGQRRFLFDMSGCSFMDSSVLAIFLALSRDVGDHGLVGIIAPSPNITRIFSVVALPAVPTFQVFDTLTEARAYLAALD
jgi:anti-anti-sigma factor